MKQYTDISVLLDRSGSMSSIKGAMEEAYNAFILKHREVPSTRITLIQFDSGNNQEIVYQNVPISDAGRLHLEPRGATPLLDALSIAIDNTGSRLASMQEADRPDQVLMVIITDGMENDSRQFTRADVKRRVNLQADHYKWQFVYLGANQDAIAEANSFGIPAWSAINYNATIGGVKSVTDSFTGKTMCYTSNTEGLRGSNVPLRWTEAERKAAVEDKVDTTTTP